MATLQATLAQLNQETNLTTERKAQAFSEAWQQATSEERAAFARWFDASGEQALKDFFILLAANIPHINWSFNNAAGSDPDDKTPFMRDMETDIRRLANKTQTAYLFNDKNIGQLPPKIVLLQIHKELIGAEDRQDQGKSRIFSILDRMAISATTLIEALINVKPSTTAEQAIIGAAVLEEAHRTGKMVQADIDAANQFLLDEAAKKPGKEAQRTDKMAQTDNIAAEELVKKPSLDEAAKAAGEEVQAIISLLQNAQETIVELISEEQAQALQALIDGLQQRPLSAGFLQQVTEAIAQLSAMKAAILTAHPQLGTGSESFLQLQERLTGQDVSFKEANQLANILGALLNLDEARAVLAQPAVMASHVESLNARIEAYRTVLDPKPFMGLITEIKAAQQTTDYWRIVKGFHALDAYVVDKLGARADRYDIAWQVMNVSCKGLSIPNALTYQALVNARREAQTDMDLEDEAGVDPLDARKNNIHIRQKIKNLEQISNGGDLYQRLLNYSEPPLDGVELARREKEVWAAIDDCANNPTVDATALLQQHRQAMPAFHYQQFLQQKALAQAVADVDAQSYRFDPQGHLLTTVALNTEDYQEIISRISEARGEVVTVETDPKQRLEELLGQEITAETLINLDISTHAPNTPEAISKSTPDIWLWNRFKAWAKAVDVTATSLPSTFARWAYGLTGPTARAAIQAANLADYRQKLAIAVDKLSNHSAQSGSINAVQEEMEMHLGLALRVFEKAFALDEASKTMAEGQWDKILAAAQRELQARVKTEFQQALVGSFQNGKIDYTVLNKTLDKAREQLGADCRRVLMVQCDAHIPQFKDRCTISVIQQAISKHAFAATTASSNDYFCHSVLGLNAHISGTDNTAHHKESGTGHQALRILSYDDGSVVVRAPSIPDVENKSIPLEKHIADTQVKIQEIVDLLTKRLPASHDGPIILNRETSLPSGFDKVADDKKNQQTLRFEIEVKAIHQYNAVRGNGKLMLMQAIPVNQHSDPLSHDSTSAMVREATLMADMALALNLKANVIAGSPKNDQLSKAYEKIFSSYQDYLQDTSTNKPTLFSESTQGKEARTALVKLKGLLRKTPIKPAEGADMKALASKALETIFVNDLHHYPRYGMLVQALSTFTQSATVAGCKSANERFAAVESRAILMRLLNVKPCQLPAAKYAMEKALRHLALSVNLTDAQASMDVLQSTMNTYHNKYTVQIRAAAAVSGLDQGAAAKLITFIKHWFPPYRWIVNKNTNRAENADMTNLQAASAGKGQAHNVKVEKYHREITGLPGGMDKRPFDKGSSEQQLVDFLKQELNRVSWASLRETGSFNRLMPEQKQALQGLINDLHHPLVSFTGSQLQAKITQILGPKTSASCLERFQALQVNFATIDLNAKAPNAVNTLQPLKDFLASPPTVAVADSPSHRDKLEDPWSFSQSDRYSYQPVSATAGDEHDSEIRTVRSDSDYSDDGEDHGVRLSESPKAKPSASRAELFEKLMPHFDATKLADKKGEKDIDYAVRRADVLVQSLSPEERAALQAKLLPPAKGVTTGEASVTSEQSLMQKVGNRAVGLGATYGMLAVAIASFVLAKGVG